MALLFVHDTLILDANCVIGLYASRQIAEILMAIPRTITVAAYVAEKETQWVYGEPNDSGQPIREPIVLKPLIDAGLLQIVTIESEGEAEAFATFSAMIRDQGYVGPCTPDLDAEQFSQVERVNCSMGCRSLLRRTRLPALAAAEIAPGRAAQSGCAPG
jgi:hypothetical protein